MKIDTLIAALGGRVAARAGGQVEIDTITLDSRRAGVGALFVALRGARADGHAYMAQVIAAGAAGLLVEAAREADARALIAASGREVALLVAEEPRAVLGELSACFYDYPARKLRVIGVTGTNGKTTTTYMLEAILAAAGRSVGVIGTVEYRWPGARKSAPNTTPESLALQEMLAHMVAAGVTDVVMEVSSHGLVTHRVEGMRFDVAIFTNLTQDHLDFHGTMEAYRDAKALLFTRYLVQSTQPQPVAVLNVEDAEGRRLAGLLEGSAARVVTTGVGVEASLSAAIVAEGPTGTVFELGGEHWWLGTPGRHNVSNALGALAAAEAVGCARDVAQRALAEFHGAPGRLERVRVSGRRAQPEVLVDYAHTPDALERALASARPAEGGRLWAVFGCGGDRDREKRGQMGAIAARLADVVVVTSDNPRHEAPGAIMEAIVAGMPPEAQRAAIVEEDRGRAIWRAVQSACVGDVVVIAGKGHEDYQEIGDERRPFDDRAVARRAMRARQAIVEGWSMGQIAAACGGRLVGEDGPGPSSVSTDSRVLRGGELFVALVGERFDGHSFVESAWGAGVSGVMVSDEAVIDAARGPHILVSDTLAALQRLGQAVWAQARSEGLHAVAVTGSNGKTTTKELLRSIWSVYGATHATSGNLNNHIGVPLTLANMPANREHFIVEMGANGPKNIAELIALAPADERIITSIGAAHIEGFGSLDGVRRTKAEIMNGGGESDHAILPHAERPLLPIPASFGGQIVTFGVEEGAGVRVAEYGLSGPQQSWARIVWPGGEGVFYLPIHGLHHATNLAAALATVVVRGLEVRVEAINEALLGLELPGGRWRQVDRGARLYLDDAYNANPSNVRASLAAFVGWQGTLDRAGARVAVLGEMRELGEQSEAMHREVAVYAAGLEALDMLLFVGRYASAQADAAREAGARMRVEAVASVEEGKQVLARLGAAVVFVKASRGARLEEIIADEASHGGDAD
jgi:murE/murF fusion protein